MRHVDGKRHEALALAACETKHHALIASTLRALGFAHHAARDVCRLFMKQIENAATTRIESHRRIVVSSACDCITHCLLHIEWLLVVVDELDLARNNNLSSRHQRLARASTFRIMRKNEVEDRIRNLVSHLVRVTHRNAFGSEEVAIRQGGDLWANGVSRNPAHAVGVGMGDDDSPPPPALPQAIQTELQGPSLATFPCIGNLRAICGVDLGRIHRC